MLRQLHQFTQQKVFTVGVYLLMSCCLFISAAEGNSENSNAPLSATDNELLIVVHPSVITSEVKLGDLRRIYLGKLKKWDNGDRIKVAQMKKGDVPDRFSRRVIEKPLSKYKLYWKRVVAAGTGIPPRSFKTEADLLEYVKKTKGAIGYVGGTISTDGVSVITITK